MLDELKSMVPQDLGTIENYTQNDGRIRLTIALNRPQEAVAKSVKRAMESLIVERTGLEPLVILREPAAKSAKPKVERMAGLAQVARVVAVASGKGGVGKSTVAANLAVSLAARGKRVGLLDADIYGPSQPKIFGCEGYRPVAASQDSELIEPFTSSQGIRIMSIGFFIKADDALVWRGPMATSALRQLIHQTQWGEIDVLVVDLPPGTGDVHLTAVAELKIDGAIVVTTPSDLALADVVRGVKMFQADNISVPIIGFINNMAYFQTPDVPGKKYYVFGTSDHLKTISAEENIPILAEIPLSESGDMSQFMDTVL